MKRIIATVFLFIFISAFSLATYADSYPISQFIAYWRYTDATTQESILSNVTSSVVRDGLDFTFPYTSNVTSSISLYLLSYSGSNISNIPNARSLSGSLSIFGSNVTLEPTISDSNFTLVVQYYLNGSWVTNYSGSFHNGDSFYIELDPSYIGRIRIDYTKPFLSNSLTFHFSSLNINDISVIDQISTDKKIDDAKEVMGMIIDPVLSDSDALHDIEEGVIVDLYNGMPAVDQAFSDASDWMDDISSTGVGFGRVMLTIYNETPFFGAISAVVSILALVSFVLFGRAF